MGQEMRAGELCTPESWLRAAPGLVHSTGLGVFSGGGSCKSSGPRRRLLTGSCWAQGLLGLGGAGHSVLGLGGPPSPKQARRSKVL